MRNHPIVNGKPTTFRALADRLKLADESSARGRFRRVAVNGQTTLKALRVVDKIKVRREKRDARILHERHDKGRQLSTIAALCGGLITPQRVQQIAGRVL